MPGDSHWSSLACAPAVCVGISQAPQLSRPRLLAPRGAPAPEAPGSTLGGPGVQGLRCVRVSAYPVRRGGGVCPDLTRFRPVSSPAGRSFVPRAFQDNMRYLPFTRNTNLRFRFACKKFFFSYRMKEKVPCPQKMDFQKGV